MIDFSVSMLYNFSRTDLIGEPAEGQAQRSPATTILIKWKGANLQGIALNDKRLKDNISTLFLSKEDWGFLLCIFNLNLVIRLIRED